MKKLIESAEWVSYNANNRGSNTTDCVKRAISFAFDLDYNQVSKELLAARKAHRSDSYKRPYVYFDVIENHGGTKYTKCKEIGLTLSEYVDNYLSNGTYLVRTGSKPTVSDHIVAVIDGRVYDSWNSLEEYAVGYYAAPNASKKSFTSIKDDLPDLVPTIQEKCKIFSEKYSAKYPWSIESMEADYIIKGYSISFDFTAVLEPTDYSSKPRTYYFEIVYVFKPTTTLEEAQSIIDKTSKVRMYDRLYAINEKEKNLAEEVETRKAAGSAEYYPRYLDGVSRKFYSSLPGWVKGLMTYMYIDRPGEYYDSYEIKIKPLPGDDIHSGEKSLLFTGYTAQEIKEALNHYKQTFELQGEF